MPKTIRLDGTKTVLSNQGEFQVMLTGLSIRYVVDANDPDPTNIFGYDSLVDGMAYKSGPSSADDQLTRKIEELFAKAESKSSGKRSHADSNLESEYAGKNRGSKQQAAMRKAVLQRDKRCVVTGLVDEEKLECAHIVGLDDLPEVATLNQGLYYDKSVGFALEKNLHASFDRHEWYFEPDGTIVILRSKAKAYNLPAKITLPAGLNVDVILKKKELAEHRCRLSCPDCWAPVGFSNVEIHRKVCEANPNKEDPNEEVPCVCGVSMRRYNLANHVNGAEHKKLVAKKLKKLG